jgi:hypothetical protein
MRGPSNTWYSKSLKARSASKLSGAEDSERASQIRRVAAAAIKNSLDFGKCNFLSILLRDGYAQFGKLANYAAKTIISLLSAR